MDFRKLTALFLTFLLLVSNTGLAVNVHYCGGKVSSVKSGFSFAPGCGMKMDAAPKLGCHETKPLKKSCCDDKTVKFKSKNNAPVVKILAFDLAGFVFPSSFSFTAYAPKNLWVDTKVKAYSCDANAPPLFKLYHSFIFYA